MLIYFYVFLFNFIFYITSIFFNKILKIYCILSFLLLIIFIGLRNEIGGDWESFLYTYENSQNYSLLEYLITNQKSLLYSFLEWFASFNGLSIYFINTICAAIFTYGLISFCSYQSNIYIGMIVATPYLINVVSMGYTKQSASIGFILLILRRNNFLLKDILFYLMAMSFHVSSAFIIVSRFFNKKLKKIHILYFSLIILIVYLFSYKQIYHYYIIYFLDKLDPIKNTYISKGGLYRNILNAIPAIIFLFNYKKFKNVAYYYFWLLLCFAAILLALLTFIFPIFSTPFDRLGLYLIPIQIIVFSNINYIFTSSKKIIAFNLLTIFIYLSYQFIWLKFAINKNAWVPYENVLF